jgi:hypothetical protein
MTSAGQGGLSRLAGSKNLSIAVFARWESSKGDQKKIREFVCSMERLVGIGVPRWWSSLLERVRITESGQLFDLNGEFGKSIDVSDENVLVKAKIQWAGFPYEIKLSDKRKPSRTWSQSVWATGTFITTGGAHNHKAEMSIQGRMLVVAGADDYSAYLEVFDMAEGAPLLRFCTCYWGFPAEGWNWSGK